MWPPLAATIASIIFGWRSIAFRIFSWLRFSKEDLMPLMNPPFVFLDGFRWLEVSYSSQRKFFQELFTLNLIVHHSVRRIVRKSTKFWFILTSKLWNERSITHVSSIRSHFYAKSIRCCSCILSQDAVGFSVIDCPDCIMNDQQFLVEAGCMMESSTASSSLLKISVKRKCQM